MKRLFVLAIAFGLIGNLSAKNTEDPTKHYNIKLSLEMPQVKDVAVIHALSDFDPMLKFKEEVLKHEKRMSTDKEYAENYKKYNIPVYIEASGSWDESVFNEVKASEVHILQQKKFGGQTSLGGNKYKKMWLVTKATAYGKPFAWAIPLDITEGFKADVVLNKKNAINLVDLYKQIVAEAAKK